MSLVLFRLLWRKLTSIFIFLSNPLRALQLPRNRRSDQVMAESVPSSQQANTDYFQKLFVQARNSLSKAVAADENHLNVKRDVLLLYRRALRELQQAHRVDANRCIATMRQKIEQSKTVLLKHIALVEGRINDLETYLRIKVDKPSATASTSRQPAALTSSSRGTTVGNNLFDNDPVLKTMDKNIVETIKREIIVLDLSLTWDDVVGLESAKQVLREIIVLPFKRPDVFTGIRSPPKGLLLFGPPGTGKTLIARCVANQCKATFFNISASSLTSKWFGEGEKLVRALFQIARLKEPSVIFIDELDSLLSSRREAEHESSRRLKTELLVQMDGVCSNSNERLLILAATNKPQELDEAARRRFPKRLYIALPTKEARLAMLAKHLSSLKHTIDNSSMRKLADKTEGFSGADMRQLCCEAAMGPIREIDCMSTVDIETVKEEDIRPIRLIDFEHALRTVKRTVLQSELDGYMEWDKKFGCS